VPVLSQDLSHLSVVALFQRSPMLTLYLVTFRKAVSQRGSSVFGQELDLDAQSAADGISRIVDESMASAGRMHAAESGKDLGNRTMIAFGGNGPLHACRVARSAGVSKIVIPTGPGVGSAIGFLYAPISFAIVRSRYALLASMDISQINTLLEQMIEEASSVVRQGDSWAPLTIKKTAFMRYNGQGHEIEIQLPERVLTREDTQRLTSTFEEHYAKQFSRPVPGMDIEILNWSVLVSTESEDNAPPSHAAKNERKQNLKRQHLLLEILKRPSMH